MKNFKFIYLLLVIIIFSSCLDEDPQYSVNSETTFEDEQTAKLALLGCYGQMTTWNSYGQAGQELLAGGTGLSWAQTGGGDQDRYVSLDPSISCVLTKMYWQGMYKTISECCFFIENMQKGTLSEELKENTIAQAKFLRALAYYNLMTTYGGVPLRIDAPSSLTLSVPRSSIEEVAAQIEKDWKESLDGLNEEESNGTASRYAAHAYLAKLYWTLACQGVSSPTTSYWELAKQHCDSVVIKGGYELEGKFANLFVNNVASKESIFQLNFSTTSSTTGNRGNWLFSPQVSTAKGISWGRIRASKAFHDWFIGTYPTDPRYDVTFMSKWTNTSSGDTQYSYPIMTYKEGRKTVVDTLDYSIMEDPTNPKLEELTERQRRSFCGAKGENAGWAYFRKSYDYDSEAQNCNKNIILFRYADFLLMMADIENELGKTTEAVRLVNKVLERARTSVAPAAVDPANWPLSLGQDEVRKEIYRERLFEMAGETTMFIDVRRRGTEYLKEIAERNNRHHITYEFATNDTVGVHKFRDRIFNKGNVNDEDFLKKNLYLPIPQEELNTNEAITVKDQNFGY